MELHFLFQGSVPLYIPLFSCVLEETPALEEVGSVPSRASEIFLCHSVLTDVDMQWQHSTVEAMCDSGDTW